MQSVTRSRSCNGDWRPRSDTIGIREQALAIRSGIFCHTSIISTSLSPAPVFEAVWRSSDQTVSTDIKASGP
jgi:hypothetical protein